MEVFGPDKLHHAILPHHSEQKTKEKLQEKRGYRIG